MQINEQLSGVDLQGAQVFSIEINTAATPRLVKICIHFINY